MGETISTDLLRTFAAVADTGGFTRAAARVNRSQSAVSQQIKRLEEEAGGPLFLRGASLSLTPRGERLLAYARRILRLHDQALAELAEPEMAGLVRLGASEDYAVRFLPEILEGFARSHPNVEVHVRCEPGARLRRRLEEGKLDLAVCQMHEPAEGREVVLHEPTVWIGSPAHQVHRLSPLPLAVYHRGCHVRSWAAAALEAMGRPYRIALSSPSISAIRAAVQAGLAVAPVPRSSASPEHRFLNAGDGLPDLPGLTTVLLRSHQPAGPADSLAEHIKRAFARHA
jgi:DNA-binding transcriptional LysR family regulator